MDVLLRAIDALNRLVGRAAAWLILPLTFSLGYEVYSRYVRYAPTTWAFDTSVMLYGALFMLAAPYTLSIGGHVRGDILYRLWPARVQATLDLVLYLLVFFPSMLALLLLGWDRAYYAYSIGERSTMSPGGPIIWPLRMVIPVTAFLMLLQGVAQVVRCVRAIRQGRWS
ncbi:MAG TPA: TRAP transporter small permease subunit [Thermodesulfobacteriota bacterium]|nr:TRAP transporter small permease subunit [Thermodesulfobacteriota bacterium]